MSNVEVETHAKVLARKRRPWLNTAHEFAIVRQSVDRFPSAVQNVQFLVAWRSALVQANAECSQEQTLAQVIRSAIDDYVDELEGARANRMGSMRRDNGVEKETTEK